MEEMLVGLSGNFFVGAAGMGIVIWVVWALMRKVLLADRQRVLAERVEMIQDDLRSYMRRFSRIEPELFSYSLSLGMKGAMASNQINGIFREVSEYLDAIRDRIAAGEPRMLKEAETMLGSEFGPMPRGKRTARVRWTAEIDGHLKRLASSVIEARRTSFDAGAPSGYIRRAG